MDQLVANFLIQLAAGLGANYSVPAISTAVKKVFALKPGLEPRLTTPSSEDDRVAAMHELAGILEALAGSGSIAIDGAVVTALRAAKFDHQVGSIRIGATSIFAPRLQTGGSGPGFTIITGDTSMRTRGTAVQVGRGAQIVISGNAQIIQS